MMNIGQKQNNTAVDSSSTRNSMTVINGRQSTTFEREFMGKGLVDAFGGQTWEVACVPRKLIRSPEYG
jgi:hypothetical protein